MFARRSGPNPLDATREDLVVVVASFDDAEACSTALARGEAGEPAWRPLEQAVLRHHLTLPAAVVEDAASIAAQDDYLLVYDEPVAAGSPDSSGPVNVLFQRIQVLDALHCSQERSRMAGLAQRHGGVCTGWDALQSPPD
ncbi:MAG: hypothetical protein GX542_11865 [Rhodococcus sp.]|nr:hypothetical protein [Rhodococcus sp. (in: high G+C Gram-positive bacteria)]